MRIRKFTSLLLLLSLVLTLFTSCKNGNSDTSDSDDYSTEQAVNIKQRVNFDRYKKELELPYGYVGSPFKFGDSLYFSAAERGEGDLFNDKLIRYDFKEKTYETLFDISGERRNISDITANENYIVWVAFDESGSYMDVYFMDLKDSSVKKLIDKKDYSKGLVPILMDDCVYWLEEREGSQGKTAGVVVCYNCTTNERIELQRLNQVSGHNNTVYANEGFLVWTDILGGGAYYYFLYNTETGKTASFKAKQPFAGNAQYLKGFIFATEFESIDDDEGTTRVINSVTGQDVKTNDLCLSGEMRAVSGSFIVSYPGLSAVHQIDDGEIKLIGALPDCCDNRQVFGSQPNCFVCIEKVDETELGTEEYINRDKKIFIFDLKKLA